MLSNCYLSKIKKISKTKSTINLKEYYIRNTYISEYAGTNYWKSYNYKRLSLRNIIKIILLSTRKIISRVYISENGTNTCLFIENIQQSILTNSEQDELENKTSFEVSIFVYQKIINTIWTTGFFMLSLIYNKNIQITIYTHYLNYEDKNLQIEKLFEKDKRKPYFIPVTQSIEAIFNENSSTELLLHLVCKYIKKNSNKIYFLTFVKRVIEWYHFTLKENSKIDGIRIEVKGRFNAKSRAKKQILSVGQVKKYKKSPFIDYRQTTVITKFGSLGIKIWISFKNNAATEIKAQI